MRTNRAQSVHRTAGTAPVRRRARASLRKWAREVAQKGSFMAPYPPEVATMQPGGLPVPLLLVSSKADLVSAAPYPQPQTLHPSLVHTIPDSCCQQARPHQPATGCNPCPASGHL